ncbi:hypothetical protein F5B18DRAFT_626532 [Nemania serpens]|nr:hypothetical protein F5B18DRAFT_626532 [Nemania serpens]
MGWGKAFQWPGLDRPITLSLLIVVNYTSAEYVTISRESWMAIRRADEYRPGMFYHALLHGKGLSQKCFTPRVPRLESNCVITVSMLVLDLDRREP